MKHIYIAQAKLHVSMRFKEHNTRGMELCTRFIIVKFYMYEVLNRCVFKLVLNLSCIYVSNVFRQVIP